MKLSDVLNGKPSDGQVGEVGELIDTDGSADGIVIRFRTPTAYARASLLFRSDGDFASIKEQKEFNTDMQRYFAQLWNRDVLQRSAAHGEETLREVADAVADMLGVYNGCVLSKPNCWLNDRTTTGTPCTAKAPTCCRTGFNIYLHHRMESAVATERAIALRWRLK